MRLSEEAKKELLEFSNSVDFSPMKKVVFAENPGSYEATMQFFEFIQTIHNMTDHPTRKFKPIEGKFLL